VGSIGPEAAPAVPVLLANLNTDNYYIRTEVAFALAQIGASARETVAVRDAVSWTTLICLAALPQDNLSTPPLAQVIVRTWIPRDEKTPEAIQAAVLQVDPDSAPRWGATGGR
jgi:hypothetical protein